MTRLRNLLVLVVALASLAAAGTAACSTGEVCFYSGHGGGGNEYDVTAGYWDWPWYIDNGDDSYNDKDTVNYHVFDYPNYLGGMLYCATKNVGLRDIPSAKDNSGDSHAIYTGSCI